MSLEFPAAFLLTNVIEMAVAHSILEKEEATRILLTVFLLNALTLPLVWLVFPLVMNAPYAQVLLASELSAFTLESIAYRISFKKTSALKAVAAAIAANALSFLIGLVL